MGPKKATTEKGKEANITEMEEIQSSQMERLEEELHELREKLVCADKQIVETRMQSLSESTKLSEMLRRQEELNKQEREHILSTCQEKLLEVCHEKDDIIQDMEERMRGYRQMLENTQQEASKRVHYRDDDTLMSQPPPPSVISAPNAEGSCRQSMFDGPRTSTVTTTTFCEPVSTPRRRRIDFIPDPVVPSEPIEDPWEKVLPRPTVTRYDVPLPRQLVYDGKMSWDSFIKPFSSTALACGWTENDKLFRLISSLRGEAAEYVFNQLSPDITESFSGLKKALESRFREKRTSSSYLNELENRKLLSKEKLLEYAADIKRLVHKGFPTADELTKETINVRYFLRGLSDQQLAVAVGMKDPRTIDDAREMVETYNSLRDDMGRSQRVRSVKFEDDSNKELSNQRRQMKSNIKETTKWVTLEDIDRLIDLKLKEKRENEMFNGRQKLPDFRRDRNSSNKNHIECFNCHKLGHYANECPDKGGKANVKQKERKEN